jgi:hypothetical protein
MHISMRTSRPQSKKIGGVWSVGMCISFPHFLGAPVDNAGVCPRSGDVTLLLHLSKSGASR